MECCIHGPAFMFHHTEPQLPCLTTPGGGWAVDFLGRVEHMEVRRERRGWLALGRRGTTSGERSSALLLTWLTTVGSQGSRLPGGQALSLPFFHKS